jgi:hypothetical protein
MRHQETDLKKRGVIRSRAYRKQRVDPERGLTTPNRSILIKLNRFCRTLVHASPTFNTILRVGRIGFVSFDFINFAGTDLGTISAAVTFLLINDRIHGYSKS